MHRCWGIINDWGKKTILHGRMSSSGRVGSPATGLCLDCWRSTWRRILGFNWYWPGKEGGSRTASLSAHNLFRISNFACFDTIYQKQNEKSADLKCVCPLYICICDITCFQFQPQCTPDGRPDNVIQNHFLVKSYFDFLWWETTILPIFFLHGDIFIVSNCI